MLEADATPLRSLPLAETITRLHAAGRDELLAFVDALLDHARETEPVLRALIPEDDRRAIELRLTAKGGKLAERFAESSPQHEMQSFAPLTPDERDELMRLLTKYVGL